MYNNRDTIAAPVWSSQNSVTGYVTDKEAAIYTRDYLEQALNSLAVQAVVKRIHIVAHPMGGFSSGTLAAAWSRLALRGRLLWRRGKRAMPCRNLSHS